MVCCLLFGEFILLGVLFVVGWVVMIVVGVGCFWVGVIVVGVGCGGGVFGGVMVVGVVVLMFLIGFFGYVLIVFGGVGFNVII